MDYFDIWTKSGEMLEGKKIKKLTEFIINKFAEEKVTAEEGKIILEKARGALNAYAIVQHVKPKEEK